MDSLHEWLRLSLELSLVMIVYANLGMLSVDVRNVSTLGK